MQFSKLLLLLTGRCRYCWHKSRHRNVAVRHVWRAHRSRIGGESNLNIQLCDLTPDDVSLAFDQTHARCPGRPPVVTSTSINVIESAAVTDGTVAAGPRTDATTSTSRSYDTGGDRLYRFRLVPASVDSSEIAGSGEVDLLAPPMNPVVPERQAGCFHSMSGRWNRTRTSAGYQRGEGNYMSPDWLCKTATSRTAGTSFSYQPLLPLCVGGEKLERSGTDRVRPAAGYSTAELAENADNVSFQKQAGSSHKCDQGSTYGSAAVRFACPLCSLSYKRAADLNRHMKQKHWASLAYPSSSSLLSASFSTARERPLNLTLKNDANQPVSRKQRGLLYCEDTPQDVPLDLSTTSKTPRSNDCGGRQTSERLFDDVTDWRSSSSHLLPPFIFGGDSVTKTCELSSRTLSSNLYSSAASLSVSAVPSFYACFTKFMENAYKPLWKSYFDGTMAQNTASSHRSATDFDCQSVFSADLNQAYMGRCTVNNKVTKLPRSTVSITDNNNNTLACDFAGRSNISADCADVARPGVLTAFKDRETRSDGPGSKDSGSWGQCPLCPFVCPHPLVMRRHLDVHDEPEVQRTTSRQTAAAASTCKTSFELGDAARRGSFLDVIGSLNSGKASALTSTAMFNCSADRSVFASEFDGTGTSDGNLLSSSTSNWLQACPLPAPDLTASVAGRSASWSSVSSLMAKSAGLQTSHEQTVPSGLQVKTEDAWRAKDRQLYECSQCGERSRSAKDVKKHVAEVHPAGGHVVTVAAASAANTTPPSLSSLTHLATPTPTRQWRFPLPPAASTGAISWWHGLASNKQLHSTFTASMNTETFRITPTTFSPLSTGVHSADFKVTFLLLMQLYAGV